MFRELVRLINKRRIRGLVFLLMAIVTAVMTFFVKDVIMEQFVSILSLVFDVLAINRIFFSEDFKKNSINYIRKVILRLSEKVINALTKLFGKMNMFSDKKFKRLSIIRDYKDSIEKLDYNSKDKIKRKKRKKYKNMTNVEKTRFLYEKKVNGAIKKGIKIEKNMTPIESSNKMIQKEYIEKPDIVLADTYNLARYNDEADITNIMVENIKKI